MGNLHDSDSMHDLDQSPQKTLYKHARPGFEVRLLRFGSENNRSHACLRPLNPKEGLAN